MAGHRHILAPMPDSCFKALLDQTFDGVSYVDAKRRILYWNKGAETITGYAAQDVVGKKCDRDEGLCHIGEDGTRLCDKLCPLLAAIEGGKNTQKRIYLRNKDGKRIPVDAVSSPVYDEQGNLQGAVQIFRDATIYEETEKANQVIAKLAATDPLTGLLNRRQLEIELELEISRTQRLKLPLSVLYGDLDNFKRVNDEHGHACGDLLLKSVVTAMQTGTRPYDRLSRFGGDEFVLLLPETQLQLGVEIAERLRRAVAGIDLACDNPRNGGQSISFGLAELRPGETSEQLINRADQALVKAKKSGRNGVFVF